MKEKIGEIKFEVCNQANNAKAYEQAVKYMEKMQKIMRIQDWDIKLEFLSANEVRNAVGVEGYAFCKMDNGLKRAIVGLNIEDPEIRDDLRQSLLHELSHIVIGEYERNVRLLYESPNNDYAAANLETLLEQVTEHFSMAIFNALKES